MTLTQLAADLAADAVTSGNDTPLRIDLEAAGIVILALGLLLTVLALNAPRVGQHSVEYRQQVEDQVAAAEIADDLTIPIQTRVQR